MAGPEQLFDEYGNILPEAEYESRMAEIAQPGQEYLQLAEEADGLEAEAAAFQPEPPMDPEAFATDRGNIRMPSGSLVPPDEQRWNHERQRGRAIADRQAELGPQIANARGTQEYMQHLGPEGMQPYMTDDQMAYAQDAVPAPVDRVVQTRGGVPTGSDSELGSDKGQSSPELDEFNREQEHIVAQQQYTMDLKEQGQVQAMENLTKLHRLYEAADNDVRKLRVNPRRWEKETPTLTKAFLLLGAGAFGFITKGKGPNPLLNIIDRAIQKDIDAQMANANIKLKGHQMEINKELGMQRARFALQTAMEQRAFNVLNLMGRNMQLGLKAQEHQEVMKYYAIKQAQSRAAHVKALAEHEYAGLESQMDHLVKIDSVASERADGVLPFLGQLSKLAGMKKNAEGVFEPAAQYVPGSAANMYKRFKNRVAYQEATVYSGKQMAAKEGEIYSKAYPSSFDDDKQTTFWLTEKTNGAIGQLEGLIQKYNGRADLRKQKADLKKAYQMRDALMQTLGRPRGGKRRIR
jgi:hypothetical protein